MLRTKPWILCKTSVHIYKISLRRTSLARLDGTWVLPSSHDGLEISSRWSFHDLIHNNNNKYCFLSTVLVCVVFECVCVCQPGRFHSQPNLRFRVWIDRIETELVHRNYTRTGSILSLARSRSLFLFLSLSFFHYLSLSFSLISLSFSLFDSLSCRGVYFPEWFFNKS